MWMMGGSISKIFGVFPPSGHLFRLIEERDWEAARNHLRVCPIDCFYEKSQNTVLHLAIVYRAPSDIVWKIFKVHPEALEAKNVAGWTPLHEQIVHGTDPDLTCQLIRGYPAAAKVYLNVGSTLHLACFHQSPVIVLQALLDVYPRALLEANELGTHAAALIGRKRGTKCEPYCLECLELFTRFVYNSVGLPQVLDFCQHYCQSRNGLANDFALLYTICRPESTKDVWKGRPALHFVVSSGNVVLLQHILDREPYWARARDSNGRLPLHKACETRKPEELIPRLLRAYPEAPLFRDPLTKLYPAQLASTIEGSYLLLKAQPSLLKHI